MNDAAEQTDTTQDLNPTERLLALQLLSRRKQRLELQEKAQKQKWRDALDTCTRELHELIEQHTPTDGDEAKHHLEAIRAAYEAHKQAERDKKGELDATKAQIAQVESAMYEVIHATDVQQMSLDLGGDDDEQGPTWLGGDTGMQISRALNDASEQGDPTADMEDLKARLENLGVAGLQLAPDTEDDEEAEAEEENDVGG